MGELYIKIEELCRIKGLNITAMCKAAGVSRAPLSDLKMGRSKTLSTDTLSRIADYFGVTVDYLLGKELPWEAAAIELDLLKTRVLEFEQKEKPAPQQDKLIKDEFIAFYGEVKQDLDEDDIADLKTFIRMKSEIKRKLAEKK